MKRRAAHAELEPASPASPAPASEPPHANVELATGGPLPRSREEADARYVIVRDAWTKAMHAANSGRPADLASLALAQEAYEVAVAERERWLTGHVALPIEPAVTRRNLEIAVDQEIAWREIHEQPHTPGLLGRLRRRIGGR